MLKLLAPLLSFVTLLSGTVFAGEPHPPLKVGDLVHLDLIGDAARTYARVNRLSLDNAASPIPVLSMYTIVRSVEDDSTISIEHQRESVIDGKRYLCTMTGTFPANAIHHEPVLDLSPSATPTDSFDNTTKVLGHNLRLRITDFSVFPKLKLQRWQLVEELDG
ncbi:hypothetical protein CA13_00360 [Planctomycetes bacterium CA13]|uniref:Flagellar basal body L-ring protein n=1 Tax=Novipirellula herctigrandis TaxID=2527986 RepID=A0A5C5YUY7_9BACT|nr:hypothetical protein CA13_00360 [Planctomycetes bacterium CA13]